MKSREWELPLSLVGTALIGIERSTNTLECLLVLMRTTTQKMMGVPYNEFPLELQFLLRTHLRLLVRTDFLEQSGPRVLASEHMIHA